MALEIYQVKKEEFDETFKELKEKSNLAKDKLVEVIYINEKKEKKNYPFN